MTDMLINIMTALIYTDTEAAVCVARVILSRESPGDFHTHNGPVQLLHTISPPLLKSVRNYISNISLILICIILVFIDNKIINKLLMIHVYIHSSELLKIGQGFTGMELLYFQIPLKMAYIPI